MSWSAGPAQGVAIIGSPEELENSYDMGLDSPLPATNDDQSSYKTTNKGAPVKFPILCVALVAGALFLGTAGPSAQSCDPDGDVQFVCGTVNSEDLVPVPESAWVVVSGMEADGHLYAADSRDHSVTVLFPGPTVRQRHNTAMYGACPGFTAEGFRPHGLSLRPGPRGLHTLYVVRHGSRESVEVFELDDSGAVPTLTWTGCVVSPDTVNGNAVVALPDGGIALTNFTRRGDPDVMTSLRAGETTGEVWEWHPGAGWTVVPGSETSGPNGLEVSRDGQWFYLGVWGSESFMRLSRGQTPVTKEVVDLGFHVDNLRWAPDGSLFAAGQGGSAQAVLTDCLGQQQCSEVTVNVTKVNPDTLEATEVISYPSSELVVAGTAAIQVGDEIWVGAIGGGDRIARFPAESR